MEYRAFQKWFQSWLQYRLPVYSRAVCAPGKLPPPNASRPLVIPFLPCNLLDRQPDTSSLNITFPLLDSSQRESWGAHLYLQCILQNNSQLQKNTCKKSNEMYSVFAFSSLLLSFYRPKKWKLLKHINGRWYDFQPFLNITVQSTKVNKFITLGQVPVAHACNPSYSEGTYQEYCGSRPALGK
jgi:hypothetical protein